jgi:two-component system response regulator
MDRDILVVEDDDAAYYALKLAFAETQRPFRLFRSVDGEDALRFLRKEGDYQNAPRPSLILLNLDLPKVTGFGVLSAVKADPDLRNIPAVVFSTSQLNSDRAKCIALGATDFISKPGTFDGLMDAVRTACAHAS